MLALQPLNLLCRVFSTVLLLAIIRSHLVDKSSIDLLLEDIPYSLFNDDNGLLVFCAVSSLLSLNIVLAALVARDAPCTQTLDCPFKRGIAVGARTIVLHSAITAMVRQDTAECLRLRAWDSTSYDKSVLLRQEGCTALWLQARIHILEVLVSLKHKGVPACTLASLDDDILEA